MYGNTMHIIHVLVMISFSNPKHRNLSYGLHDFVTIFTNKFLAKNYMFQVSQAKNRDTSKYSMIAEFQQVELQGINAIFFF